MIQFKKTTWTDGKMKRSRDGQTLFYRTLPAMTRCPKSFYDFAVASDFSLLSQVLLGKRQSAQDSQSPDIPGTAIGFFIC